MAATSSSAPGKPESADDALVIELDDLVAADEKRVLFDRLALSLCHPLESLAASCAETRTIPRELADALILAALTEAQVYVLRARVATAGADASVDALRALLPTGMHSQRAVLMQLRALLSRSPGSAHADALRAAWAARAADFFRPPTVAPHADTHADALARFVDAHLSAHPPAVRLATFGDTGRGLASAAPLQPGDTALAVPLTLVLSAARLRHEAAGMPLAARLDGVDDDTTLALALLRARATAGSAWAAYGAELLPRAGETGHCTEWAPRHLAALQGSAVGAEAEGAMEALRAQYAALFPALDAHLYADATAGGSAADGAAAGVAHGPPTGWGDFVWAAAIVATRALLVDLSAAPGYGPLAAASGKVGVLVPVADMLNHHARAPLASARYEPSAARAVPGGALVFEAVAPVPAGAQLRLYYGQLQGWETLLQYGFVPSAPPADDAGAHPRGAGVAAEAEAEAEAEADTVRFVLEPPDEEDDSVALQKAVLLAAHAPAPCHHLHACCPLPPQLLCATRIALLDRARLQACARSAVDLEVEGADAEHEASVWQALAHVLGQMRAAMPGTITEDEQLLRAAGTQGAGPSADGPLLSIVAWRVQQKRVLQRAVELAEARSDALAEQSDGAAQLADGASE